MSVNKYRPHLLIIPEDDANRQLANGFLLHHAVAARVVNLRGPAGGWREVFDVFETEYLRLLRGNGNAHVVMLIDFDDKVEDRKVQVAQRIPADVSERVFVVGSKNEPETLRSELGMSLETIGRELAEDCLKDDFGRWGHPHLIHNNPELQRMATVIKPVLFQGS